jgi:pimeloyl-ACP methyl ester carboxylesterase
MTRELQTQSLATDGAEIVYDVRGPLPTEDGRPPLVMIGSPMDAAGFATLAGLMDDRTVVTYDPRGLGRSTRSDGATEQRPQVQAADLHALVSHLDAGPVDVFASSGGAVAALAWVTAYPDDLATVVAHEPPLIAALPDATAAARAFEQVRKAYADKGSGAGMAGFIHMTSWQGEFTDDYFAAPLPAPAAFGLPADDDGSREDPLLSERSRPVGEYQPDVDALKGFGDRLRVAVGVESAGTFTDRTSRGLASLLGADVVEFPSHHGGFAGPENGYPGQPEAFAERLREVLSD